MKHIKSAAVVVIGLIFSVWVAWWWAIPWKFRTMVASGLSGDMFGSLNALFSGLAFVGLILALLLQIEELSQQRETSEKAQLNMNLQQVQMAKQASLLDRQVVEGTLFSLLGMMRAVVADLPGSRGYFKNSLGQAKQLIVIEGERMKNFEEVWRIIGDESRPWIAILEQLFVAASRAFRAERKEYIALVAAHISPEQRAILAFCARAGALPERLAFALHAHGVFEDLNKLLFGQALAVSMTMWIKAQHEEARVAEEAAM